MRRSHTTTRPLDFLNDSLRNVRALSTTRQGGTVMVVVHFAATCPMVPGSAVMVPAAQVAAVETGVVFQGIIVAVHER
jgi:hypothetical protein